MERERPPGLTAREHWARYALGIVVESAYVLALAATALALAIIARAVFG